MSDLEIQQLRRKFGLEKYPAILGDANGIIEDDSVKRPGMVRVRYTTAAGLSLPPIVSIGAYQGQMTPGASVWVGWMDDELCLLRPHTAGQRSQGINPSLNNGADQRPTRQQAAASIINFKSHPTSPPSAYVVVRSLLYRNGSTVTLFAASEDDGSGGFKGKLNLTSYISTAGNHRLICLFLNEDTNLMEIHASTEKSMLDPLGLTDLQECYTAASTNVKPCWAWLSADAKATFDDADSWLDLRELMNVTATNAGGAPATSKYLLQQADAALPNAQAMSALATGLVKNAATTGVQTIAAAGTDYTSPSGTENLSGKTITNSSIGSANPSTGAFTSLSAASSVWAVDTSGIITHTPGATWLDSDTSAGAQTVTVTDAEKDAQASGTTAYTLATKYVAVKFVPTSSYTTRRLTVWLKWLSGTTTGITAKLYSDSAGTPGTLLATGSILRHGVLTGSFVERSFGLVYAITSGTTYWIVLDSSALSAADAYIDTSAATSAFATSADAVSWSVESDKRLRYRVLAGNRLGIAGTSYNSNGVIGTSKTSAGVKGASETSHGVYGTSDSGIAGYFLSTYGYGAYGSSTYGNAITGLSTEGYGAHAQSTNSIGLYATSSNYIAAYVYRNTASPSAVPVLSVRQDNASDTNLAALIRQDGTGNILNLSNGTDATVRWSCSAAGVVTGIVYDSATNAVTNELVIGHNSSGTPAAGFGTGILIKGQSSTTVDSDMASIQASWATATHLSRSADLVFMVNYTSTAREAIRARGGSSDAQIGFLGATPVSRQALGTWSGLTTDQRVDALRDALSNLGLASYAS